MFDWSRNDATGEVNACQNDGLTERLRWSDWLVRRRCGMTSRGVNDTRKVAGGDNWYEENLLGW